MFDNQVRKIIFSLKHLRTIRYRPTLTWSHKKSKQARHPMSCVLNIKRSEINIVGCIVEQYTVIVQDRRYDTRKVRVQVCIIELVNARWGPWLKWTGSAPYTEENLVLLANSCSLSRCTHIPTVWCSSWQNRTYWFELLYNLHLHTEYIPKWLIFKFLTNYSRLFSWKNENQQQCIILFFFKITSKKTQFLQLFYNYI